MTSVALYSIFVIVEKGVKVVVANAYSAYFSYRIDEGCDFFASVHISISFYKNYTKIIFHCQSKGKKCANTCKEITLIKKLWTVILVLSGGVLWQNTV